MTYSEIINRIQQAVEEHQMLKDFGYGQLSDIKVHATNGANYPYVFLNPATHQRAGSIMNYNFNLICMDIATDEDDTISNYMGIQSACQQYIDDIIAKLYYGYKDKPEVIYENVTYTPFKERFQDSVAGMTATLQIQVPTPINYCVAPYPSDIPTPTIPNYDALIYTNTTLRTLANTNAAFVFETEYSDPDWFIGGPYSNFFPQKQEPVQAIISYEGIWNYRFLDNPANWQLAIYNTETDTFIGMTDLPSTSGFVTITSDIFTYPATSPFNELSFLTLYEKGTPNPIPTPSGKQIQPLTYSGQFKIKVVN